MRQLTLVMLHEPNLVISTIMTTAVTGLCTTAAKKQAIATIMTSCGSIL